MRQDNIYAFTNEELTHFSEVFRNHVSSCGDDGNSGRYKIPKHWMRFVIFSQPRSGKLYKGIQCQCGFEWYEVSEGGAE